MTSPCCPTDMNPSASAVEAGATSDLMGQYLVLPLDGRNKTGVRCYVVNGAETDDAIQGAVVVFHDIFGFNSGRTHHMCDEIAVAGKYLVIAPDFFGESHISDPKELLSLSFFSKGSTLVSRACYPFGEVENKLHRSVFPYIRQRTR